MNLNGPTDQFKMINCLKSNGIELYKILVVCVNFTAC